MSFIHKINNALHERPTTLPKASYDKLDEHDDSESSSQTGALLENYEDVHNRASRRIVLRNRWLSLVATASIFANIMMLFIGIRWQLDFPRKCLKYTDQYSPGLDIVDPIPHKVQFNGTLGFPSPFTGKPSQEIDDAWAEHDTVIEKTRFLTVTADELRDMGWDPADGVKVPEEYGGGYMAYPEVTHMLHCVNFLRMATFPEYYNINTKASIEWDEKDPRIIRPHLDHCAEMLRQSISCKADVTLMTYNRVKGYPKPLPDFSTRHKCRNLPSVLDWLKSRAIPAPPPEYAFPYAPDSRLFSKSPQPDVYLKMHPDAKTEYGRPVAEIVEI